METMLTVHSKWPRGMCREHISTVKPAGGFTCIYLKDMSKLPIWPDFAEACTERVTQRQTGRHMVRCVEREFHESRNRVPRFLLQSRRRSQKNVSW